MVTQMTNRSSKIDRRIRADDKGEYTFPLSSEEPYRRWDGIEILSHDDDAVDLEWLRSGNAPLLDSHKAHGGLGSQIGVIRDAWLEGRRVYVRVAFSNRPDAQAIKSDVDDGIVRNVSIGYDVKEVLRSEDSEEYTVTRWVPKEASFVPIPADETVGMGRSRKGQAVMEEDQLLMPGGRTDEQRAADMETAVNEITALAETHNCADFARAYIKGQLDQGNEPSVTVFKGMLRAKLPEDRPLRNEEIGLSERQTQQFSIMRLLRTMAPNATAQDREDASFELEAVAAAARNAEVTRGGVTMPAELMRSWGVYSDGEMTVRAPVSVGSNANVQDVDHLSSRFIDNLRNATVSGQIGVTVMQGLSGNIEIPGGDTNITAAWLAAEDADAAESVPTFRKVEMAVHDLAVYTDITRRMMQQSTISIELYVRNQILQAMAEAIDNAFFYGTGATGIPRGMANITGIGSVTFAGAIPTRDELIDMRKSIASTNRTGAPVFVTTTDMVADLQKTKVDAGSGVFLMSNTDNLELGNTVAQTNNITAGDVWAGIWSDAMMGFWGSLELDRDVAAKFLSGGVRLRAIQSVDFNTSRVGSIVLGNDG